MNIPLAKEAESCDAARWSWFSAAVRGREVPSAPGESGLADIAELRQSVTEDEEWQAPDILAHRIEQYYGWPAQQGIRLDQTGAPSRVCWWNWTRDGSVLDASAPRGPAVHPPGSDGWRSFRREWHSGYNPDQADRYPELAGAAWSGEADLKAFERVVKPEQVQAPGPGR